MSTPSHNCRAIIELYVDVHRTGDTSRLGEIIAPDFHYRAGAPVGVEGVASGVATLHAGFSDIACTIEQCPPRKTGRRSGS